MGVERQAFVRRSLAHPTKPYPVVSKTGESFTYPAFANAVYKAINDAKKAEDVTTERIGLVWFKKHIHTFF